MTKFNLGEKRGCMTHFIYDYYNMLTNSERNYNEILFNLNKKKCYLLHE